MLSDDFIEDDNMVILRLGYKEIDIHKNKNTIIINNCTLFNLINNLKYMIYVNVINFLFHSNEVASIASI